MVQNCCVPCMESIGQFVCFILCCKCCCCCCKKKQESDKSIELQDNSRPETIFGNTIDEESIYNGSSIYEIPSIIKQQPYSENGTSGVYMSDASLYSGSIMENKNELKIELTCEIKGTVLIGGIEQSVKGILNIIPDDKENRQPVKKSIYAVNPTLGDGMFRNTNTRSESFQIKTNKSIYNKPPQPLPREKETEITSEENNIEIYDEPRPPLPVKNKKVKDPSTSYDPVYENMEWKFNKTSGETSTDDRLYNIKKSSTQNFTETDEGNTDDHIYEDIDPSYYGPFSRNHLYSTESKREDYEIYMS